jgi:hypothetical protein
MQALPYIICGTFGAAVRAVVITDDLDIAGLNPVVGHGDWSLV